MISNHLQNKSMKKKIYFAIKARNACITRKFLRTMKLTFFLLLLAVIQVSGLESYSQETKLSLNFKNTPLKDILASIENQSEFYFMYSSGMVDVDRKIDAVKIDEKNVFEVLDEILKNTDIEYTVKGRQILLSGKSGQASLFETGQQQKTVSGKVTDPSGLPLPGVSVVVKGTTQGTITATDGSYSMTNVRPEAILLFSFVGMKTQEITISGKSIINITLTEETFGIEEVVAIGYGTKSKETLTGAISVIENEVLENRPSTETTDLLQGISSGVQITRTNTGDIRSSTNSITIRGITSRSAPGVLVVVDGITQAYTDSRALDNINPNDIESISILKDGQAAIYGARAAGGVILVTTKSGKTDKPTINASVISTIQKPSLMRKTLNVLDLYEMQNEGFVNDGKLSNQFTVALKYIADNNITLEKIKQNTGEYSLFSPYDEIYSLGDYDWNDIMYDPSLQQNYNISISGKKDKLTYYESVNYIDQDGMLAYGKNYQKRLLVTLKNDYEVTKFLKIKSNFNIGNQKTVEPYGYSKNSYNGGVQGALFFIMPFVPPYTKGGHYVYSAFQDPIGYAEAAGYRTDLSYIIHGNLGAEITPFKDLVITADMATNYDINEVDWASIGFPMYDINDKFVMYSSDDSNTGPNKAGADYARTRYTISNFYARYSYEKLVNHKINLVAGYSHEEYDYRSFSAYRKLGLISEQLPTMTAGSADEQYNSEGKTDYALNSAFSRLEYSYKDRYMLDGVFRYDGSSKFAKGHKWSPFLGFSGGWIVSEENFMKGMKNTIDFFKIRASWGELGNQSGIGLYDYISSVTIGGSYPMGSATSPYQAQNAMLGDMASTTRSWEKIESKNIGIDFRAFNSGLTGLIDVYIKDNKDMFFSREYPQVLGTTPPSINGAHLRTKGWEFEIGWRDKIKQINYFIKLNLSNNNTEVIELADAIIPKQGTNNYVQGYPALSYFGYKYDGLIQTDAELTEYKSSFTSGIPNTLKLGDARYKDMDGDGKLEALPYSVDENGNPTSTSGDLVQIGDAGQHYLYGINLGISWKNFDFSSFFQGVVNWQVISTIRPCNQWFEPIEGYFFHQTWAPDRTDAMYPRLSQTGAVKTYNYQYSDAPFKMYNNRYIRLKNIQIGYTMPKRITSKLNIDKLRVYFNGTDIWEHSGLPGDMDPETPFSLRLSPFPRQFSFGLNLTL